MRLDQPCGTGLIYNSIYMLSHKLSPLVYNMDTSRLSIEIDLSIHMLFLGYD